MDAAPPVMLVQSEVGPGPVQGDFTYSHTVTTPVITIHPDGTMTFYDKDGNKIRDYDPGEKAKEAIKAGLNNVSACVMRGL
jgi:hypothetical protein